MVEAQAGALSFVECRLKACKGAVNAFTGEAPPSEESVYLTDVALLLLRFKFLAQEVYHNFNTGVVDWTCAISKIANTAVG